MVANIVWGNAYSDGADRRGWFIGHFVDGADDPRSTEALEVKWAIHPAGEQRQSPAVSSVATALAILIRGRFRYRFGDREITLAREGDYVLWPAGVPHDWTAEEDTVVLTIRWPSKPADSVDLPGWSEAAKS